MDSNPIESLRGPAEFDPIFACAHKVEVGCVSVRFFLGDGPGPTRLGLIAPKKKAPLASRRNAFKRVSREAARQLSKDLGGMRSADLVVSLIGMAKDVEVDAFKKIVAQDLRAALEKALALAMAGPAPVRSAPARKPKR